MKVRSILDLRLTTDGVDKLSHKSNSITVQVLSIKEKSREHQ